MAITIGGVRLTEPQRRVLDTVVDYLRRPENSVRVIPVLEIFPQRTNVEAAKRRVLAHLSRLGVLRSCEIAYQNGVVFSLEGYLHR
jgi:hypothetical protein